MLHVDITSYEHIRHSSEVPLLDQWVHKEHNGHRDKANQTQWFFLLWEDRPSASRWHWLSVIILLSFNETKCPIELQILSHWLISKGFFLEKFCGMIRSCSGSVLACVVAVYLISWPVADVSWSSGCLSDLGTTKHTFTPH